MIRYDTLSRPDERSLNRLFQAAWGHGEDRDFAPVLDRSLGIVTAHDGDALIGFVNIAWDGGQHAFLIDTTVHPDWQRRGIGTGLVGQAVALASRRGARWLHVDYVADLAPFYAACGFRRTTAGIIDLTA